LRDIANGGIRNANNITGEGKELNRWRARQRMFYEKHSKKEIEKLFKE
jgi:uncharacterized protein YhfF